MFVAEVLSPATEAFDRGAKFATYRQLDSLQSYWLIDSRTQAIDCFRRAEDNACLLHSHTGPSDKLALPELDLALDFAEIYADVTLDAEPPLIESVG